MIAKGSLDLASDTIELKVSDIKKAKSILKANQIEISQEKSSHKTL